MGPGVLALCSDFHPLAHICLNAWHPHEKGVMDWRKSVQPRGQYLLGKLVLSQLLVLMLIIKVV